MNFDAMTTKFDALTEHNVKQILRTIERSKIQMDVYADFMSGALTEEQFNDKCFNIAMCSQDSDILAHARAEIHPDAIPNNSYDRIIAQSAMDLLRVFGWQNRSGMSADIVINLFYRLAKFEPILPLTGKADEWRRLSEDLWQNKRCGHVFATGPNGEGAYDRAVEILLDADGSCLIKSKSNTPISFPYKPRSMYVDLDVK